MHGIMKWNEIKLIIRTLKHNFEWQQFQAQKQLRDHGNLQHMDKMMHQLLPFLFIY